LSTGALNGLKNLKTEVQDQKRVMDPNEAFLAGSDYLVIGRSLTKTTQFNERLNSLKK
jgi:orotidine-5'-phosphate decarboxylase